MIIDLIVARIRLAVSVFRLGKVAQKWVMLGVMDSQIQIADRVSLIMDDIL